MVRVPLYPHDKPYLNLVWAVNKFLFSDKLYDNVENDNEDSVDSENGRIADASTMKK